jgi:RNA polymerase sigma factor (sigma-70 family)
MERADIALVQACRAGDQEAWEQLVRRYQRLIYSIPLRAGLDQDSAADVFQLVFTKLYEKLDSLTQPERLSAWLVTTAKRESWALQRRQQRSLGLTQPDSDDMSETELLDPGLLPDELLERMERQHLVRQALAQLDERCRVLLQLLFFQHEPPPYAEIAARLGTSEGSIGPTRARCFQKLRTQMSQLGL